MLNKATLIGNLGRDPEVRRTQDGKPIVQLSIATSERWKDRQTGDQREATEWHRVVIFNEGLAGVAERYLKKGSKVYVEGKIKTRKWQDQSGQERYTTEIVLGPFDAKLVMLGDRDNSRADQPSQPASGASAPTPTPSPRRDELNDEIPF